MLERYTAEARRVVVLAQEQARSLGHPSIGTEHLLLGLLAAANATSATLAAGGVTHERVDRFVRDVIGGGEVTLADEVPYTDRAQRVLELSRWEAVQLGHNFVASGHILLALLREGEGLALRAIGRAGGDPTQLRAAVHDDPDAFAQEAASVEDGHQLPLDELVAENQRLRDEVGRLQSQLDQRSRRKS